MNEFFKNQDANSRMELIVEEISRIVESLELCDIMMPSNSTAAKNNIEESTKKFFYDMAYNTLQFVENKLNLFENELNEMKILINEDERKVIYYLDDMIIINLCRTLAFELGRISVFVDSKNQYSKEEMVAAQASIFKTLELLKRINNLDKTDDSKKVIIELERRLNKLDANLNKTSIFKRLKFF